MKKSILGAFVIALVASSSAAWAQANWAMYGSDEGSTRFSTLTQINAANVKDLERAWTFHTGAQGPNEGTPLIINSVMYLSAANGYFALDAVTGQQIWKYDTTDTTLRGVAYWPGDAKSPARIIGAVAGGKIVALDVKTGKPVPEFGDAGFVTIGARMTSPPAVYKDTLILPTSDRRVRAWNARTGVMEWSFNLVPQEGEANHDSWQNDAWKTTGGVSVWGYITIDPKLGIAYIPTDPPSPDYVGISRPGDTLYGTSLVALNVNTGKLVWYQQLVHHDLWDFDSSAAPTLIDVKKNGKVIPAVVHIGKTGLMYIFDRRDGTPVFGMEERPVVQSTVPGEKSSPTQPFPVKPPPIARISMKMSEIPTNITPELTAYCQGLVDKYKLPDAVPYNAWPVGQDVVEFPGALGGGNWNGTSYNPTLGLIYTNVMNVGQWGHLALRQPGQGRGPGGPGGPGGAAGGPGGAAAGPDGAPGGPGGGAGGPGLAAAGGAGGAGAAGGAAGAAAGRGGRGGRGGAAGAAGPGAGAAGAGGGAPAGADDAVGDNGRPAAPTGPTYGKTTPEAGRFWQADTRYSCAPPPWGELVAVNANTGDIAWRKTLGGFKELEAKGLDTGSPNLGGSITTASNLIFIGATIDSKLHAFDAKTGKELWTTDVGVPAHSIPATYVGKDGRQYVVISAAGGGYLRDPTADTIYAYALPAAEAKKTATVAKKPVAAAAAKPVAAKQQ